MQLGRQEPHLCTVKGGRAVASNVSQPSGDLKSLLGFFSCVLTLNKTRLPSSTRVS